MRMLSATAMAVALSAAVASDAQAWCRRVEVPPWVVVPVYGDGPIPVDELRDGDLVQYFTSYRRWAKVSRLSFEGRAPVGWADNRALSWPPIRSCAAWD
jgi:hypothetical protein